MNKRVENIEISGIRRFFNKVSEVPGALSLTLGQPDFEVPTSIKEGMIRAINEGKTVYTSNSGIVELREEISKYLKSLGVNYSKDEVCITVGGSEGLYAILTALINAGDKVLVPSPAYPAYESIINILGGEIINYGLKEDFTIDINEIIEKHKESKAKYLILSFPSNPTGAILGKEERDELVEFIKENDIKVITDEIYSSIIFEEYYSVAQIDEIKDKIIYVSGFSKMFSSTGLRIGFFACNEEVMKQAMKVHQYAVSCATSFVQWGVYYGFEEALSNVEAMKESFKRRKEYCTGRLRDMGIEVAEAKGAFYLFPSIAKFDMSSDEFCERLLRDGKVACVPGSAFGAFGEGFMRISYCYSDEELKKALDGIENFIKEI
ncbi:MAG: pyridoxal phosphate-dependent aminotransferase [Clostridium sp.]